MQWASVGHGRCRALQRTERDLHRDRAASAVRGAPTRAIHALPSSPYSLLPTLRSGRPSGTADAVPCRGQRGIYTGIARHLPCEARPRAPATHYPLIPSPYFGSPLHSGHALPSYPSSLLPTLEAHCIVATHYLLHSSPYSLLYPKYGAHLIESADHVLSELFHGGACFREALLMHIT